MINLLAILTANGTAVMLLLILYISKHRNTHYELFDEKIYSLMIFITILQCVVESATFYIDGRTEAGFHTLAIVLNSALYINSIMFAFSWTIYADYKIFESKERLKKVCPFVAIPAILIMIGAIVNLFTPVFFTITAENVYQRTDAYIIPYAFTYLYLLYGTVLIYAYRNKVQKYLFLPALVFMFPIFVGSVLQFFFYGLSLVWIGAAIALVSLYVNVQSEVAYIDGLSGLFTRQYLNNYLRTETKKTNAGKTNAGKTNTGKMNTGNKLVGIMLDIDQFKNINDTFGHLIGDKAIASVGKILRYCTASNGFAARFAGDEFVVITSVKHETEIPEMIRKIQDETHKFNETGNQPYELHFSVGYTVFQYGTDTADTFFAAIDAAMYEDKRRKMQSRMLPERRTNNNNQQ